MKSLIDVIISLLQLFLHFSLGSAPSAGLGMDIIVENTCTVKEVRREYTVYTYFKNIHDMLMLHI